MAQDPADRCTVSPEETAELYLLGRLSPDRERTFEDHYITCPECAEVLEREDLIVRLLRKALQEKTMTAGRRGSG